ncbi:MAG TPA: Asp-tRNA(Asn)/Glu-tRNA(Gln) amidotransferase subunit GatB [Phycisphaerales bacterium]|nr:Asp-tRNA(Asn)/Glu-tRNA(Gln) amidotransferase subunit GatB [Phycisphaerales bacterium]
MRGIRSAKLKIGMEVHVELATRTKMFSRSLNVAHPDNYEAEPNTLVDPVVFGLPGALPVPNERAVEMAMMVGMTLGCEIAKETKWDRKNYFYPDLPKGYQISQYDMPLCMRGALEFEVEEEEKASTRVKRVRILRAHLEEDTGKLSHELPGGGKYDGSLVDLNRAGTPLLEIVTEPDFESAEEVVVFAKELRNICRFLGVTEGIMQRGHMRFEPNVNVIIEDEEGGVHATPIVEVKNLNSFRHVKAAIEHEFTRQVEQWKADGQVQGMGMKSTRGWDDVRGCTVLQRAKEDAHDYRYFPEPDIPMVVVDEAWKARVEAELPELPMQKRARYAREWGLSVKDANALTDERETAEYFEACVQASGGNAQRAKECAKVILNVGAKLANERGVRVEALGVKAKWVAELIEMREKGEVGSNAGERLFGMLAERADKSEDVKSVRSLAEAEKLIQVRDEGALDAWVEEAIKMQASAAADFAAGKDAAAGRLVGQVMKLSKGQADASAVSEKLRARLRPSPQ